MKRIIATLFVAAAFLGGCTEPEPTFKPGQSQPQPGETENPGDPGNPGDPSTPDTPDTPISPDDPIPPRPQRVEDWSGLVKSNHPRIFMDDKEFATMKARVEAGKNPYLAKMHTEIMRMAKVNVAKTSTIEHKYDVSGRRMLSVAKMALHRILSCAYAYRYTLDPQYLDHAEKDINDLCKFPDWNAAKHFLDTAEFAAAVALGYDWLYWDLSEATRSLVRSKIKEYAIDNAKNGIWSMNFYNATNNWNQVCNCGLVIAALATYEDNQTDAKWIINKAKDSNMLAMKDNYSPDGNYPEGPGYWGYGTLYQTLMNTALETTIGTDFYLSDMDGFDKTGEYYLHSIGGLDKAFNYSDNVETAEPGYPLWYFADRFDKPELLVREKMLLENGVYYQSGDDAPSRWLPVIMAHVWRVDPSKASAPTKKLYVGKGLTPVAMVHKTWSFGQDETFLGIKGGKASANHAHMDAGTFVFDDEGVRWSMDLPRESYGKIENGLKAIGVSGGLFNMVQSSTRWDVTRLNNRYHSTLTINDTNHKVDGKATITQTFDTDAERGATLNLTPVFSGEAQSVTRKVVLLNEKELQILDEVKATSSKDAKVRWTMVTKATPTIGSDHIKLTYGSRTRYLTVAGGDLNITFKNFGIKPTDFGKKINKYETEYTGGYVIGFEATVLKGKTGTFKVKLARNK